MRLILIIILFLLCQPLLFAETQNFPYAYVSSQEKGIYVINLETLMIEKIFDVKAKGSRGIGVTEDGTYLITANKEDGNLSVIERQTGKLIKHISVGKNPEFIRVVGNTIFVSVEPSSSGKPPSAEIEKEDDDKIPAHIAVVDIQKGKLYEIVGGMETEGIEFSQDGKKIVITNEADNTISVHQIADGKLLKTISTKGYGSRPRGVKLSPDGTVYAVTLEYGNQFLVLNKNYDIIKSVPTGESPYGVSFDETGKRIFVANSKAQNVQVFDTQSFKKIKDISTDNRCWHFSFTPDNQKLLVVCGKSNNVVIIDANSLTRVGEIPNLNKGWGIVTYPKTMGSLDSK